jgi:phosphoglycolate phosphatase
VKTLIFDFDGTIADSFEMLLSVFGEITGRQQKLTPAEVKALRGKSLGGIIKYLKIKRWQIPRMVIKAKKLITLQITTIETFSGMAEALGRLTKAGHPMFILSTNSSENISAFLKNNNLDDYFVSVYGDIGLRSKSSALKKIMRKEKIKAADCVYIGDEVRDIEAAKKANVTPVAVGWGFNFPEALEAADPSALAQKPKDLLKILK